MPDVFFFLGVLFLKHFACVFWGATSFFNIVINVCNVYFWVKIFVMILSVISGCQFT